MAAVCAASMLLSCMLQICCLLDTIHVYLWWWKPVRVPEWRELLPTMATRATAPCCWGRIGRGSAQSLADPCAGLCGAAAVLNTSCTAGISMSLFQGAVHLAALLFVWLQQLLACSADAHDAERYLVAQSCCLAVVLVLLRTHAVGLVLCTCHVVRYGCSCTPAEHPVLRQYLSHCLFPALLCELLWP
jgi:hypothetical protein